MSLWAHSHISATQPTWSRTPERSAESGIVVMAVLYRRGFDLGFGPVDGLGGARGWSFDKGNLKRAGFSCRTAIMMGPSITVQKTKCF